MAGLGQLIRTLQLLLPREVVFALLALILVVGFPSSEIDQHRRQLVEREPSPVGRAAVRREQEEIPGFRDSERRARVARVEEARARRGAPARGGPGRPSHCR